MTAAKPHDPTKPWADQSIGRGEARALCIRLMRGVRGEQARKAQKAKLRNLLILFGLKEVEAGFEAKHAHAQDEDADATLDERMTLLAEKCRAVIDGWDTKPSQADADDARDRLHETLAQHSLDREGAFQLSLWALRKGLSRAALVRLLRQQNQGEAAVERAEDAIMKPGWLEANRRPALVDLFHGADQGEGFFDDSQAEAYAAALATFETKSSGEKSPTSPGNVGAALLNLGADVAWDSFSKKFLLRQSSDSRWRSLEDVETSALWYRSQERFGFRPSMESFAERVKFIARLNPFHPVRDYLSGLKWDGTPRVDFWLRDYFGAADTEYVRAVSRLFLIAAVRRVREPGCKFDELPVLESPEGREKSTGLLAMCDDPEWFSDDLPLGVESQQMIERTGGKWIIEAAECLNLGRRETDQLKASLSRRVDGPVRLAYARSATEAPRHFVIIGTTNKRSYLTGTTGNRRIWPVAVDTVDVAAIRRDRDQIWAEAAEREAKGEAIRLPKELWAEAGREQEARRTEDPWEPTLRAAFPDPGASYRVPHTVVWGLLGLDVEKRTEQAQSRVTRIMELLGFESKKALRVNQDDVTRWGAGQGPGMPPLSTTKTYAGWARGFRQRGGLGTGDDQ